MSFLVATDVAVIALLVSLLTGCVTTPSGPYRNGDFVSHMASVAPVEGDRAAIRPVALPTEVATRPEAATRPARG